MWLKSLQLLYVFILTDGKFSLEHIEAITESYNRSKCRVVDPFPSGYIYTTVQPLRLREHCGRRVRQSVRAMGLDFCEMLSSGHGMALVLMNLQQQYLHAQGRNYTWPSRQSSCIDGYIISSPHAKVKRIILCLIAAEEERIFIWGYGLWNVFHATVDGHTAMHTWILIILSMTAKINRKG